MAEIVITNYLKTKIYARPDRYTEYGISPGRKLEIDLSKVKYLDIADRERS